MKILIAYDGSKCSEAAIDDLARGGLPTEGTVKVISVAEVWLPPADAVETGCVNGSSAYVEELVRRHRESGERAVIEAETLARHAERRVKVALPEWDVSSGATYGSPASELLDAAEKMGADLVVVGSHGHSELSRLFLGSISQKVLTEARCSVRVARGSIYVEAGPERVVIGFDGSKGAAAAVDAVSTRNWSKDSEVRLVAVSEQIVPSAIGRFVPPINKMVAEMNVSETLWLERLAEVSLEKLRGAGLGADLRIYPGNPKTVLVQAAESWGADCIFVGANAWGSRLERILIGSTSAAVAARAHCSVEVVRTKLRAGAAPGTNLPPNGKRK